MSLLYDASLIVTPNAYKEGKLYALKPSNGDGDFTFTRATTATRVNSAGLIESVAANVPRINYPIGGGCPHWLVEPQRTNNILYSNVETLNNAALTCTPTTLVGVGALSVLNNSGTVHVASTGSGAGNFYRVTPGISMSVLANEYVTYSFYIRKDSVDGNVIDFWLLGTTPNSVRFQPRYNFETDTVLQFQLPTNIANTNVRREEVDTNTYFVEATFQALADTILTSPHFVPYNNNGQFTIAAPQVEVGSNATSYIPTSGTAVTRNRDEFTISSASALIGQTQGTVFVSAELQGQSFSDGVPRMLFSLSLNGLTSDRIELYRLNNQIYYDNIVGGVIQFSGAVYNITTFEGTIKVAFVYELNNVKTFINGALVNTDLTALIPATNKIVLGAIRSGSLQWGGLIGDFVLYDTLITDAQAIAMTTI